MLKLNLPSWATTVLSLLAGVVAVLNTTTFGFDQPWKQILTIGALGLSTIGISPLIGPAFRNALHLSHNVMVLITAAVVVLGGAVETFSWSTSARGITIGILAVLGGLGFGTGTGPVPVVAPPQPASPQP